METLYSVLRSRWGLWLLLALGAALLVWHFWHLARAMRPARGTLEWIAQIDRPEFSLWRGAAPGREDVLPVVLCMALALAFRGFGAALANQKAISLGLITPLRIAQLVLRYGLSPMLSAAALYFLARRFSGGPLVPALASAIASLCPADAYALPFLLLAALFAARYFAARAAGDSGFCDLLVSAAVLAVGVYFRAAAAYFGFVLYLLVFAGAAAAFLHAQEPRRGARLALAAAGYPLLALAFYVLANLPGAAFAGRLNGEFFTWFSVRALANFGGTLFAPRVPAFAPAVLAAALYALPAAAFSLVHGLRQRDFRGPAAALLFLGGFGLLLCSGCDVLAAFSMPACAYLWDRWLSRGGKKHVLAAGLVLLALAVLACVASWVLYL